jgi:glutamate/tyrosine decarboxylase-like PLP-dependent enzyme
MDSLRHMRDACARPLDQPDADALRAASAAVVDAVIDDFTRLAHRDVGRAPARAEMEALLREALPEQGIGVAAALATFREHIASNALRPSHPCFLAFVPGPPCFPALLGDWLCAGWNLFAGVWKEAAGPAQVELVVLDWLRDILGMPAGTGGILTSGSSEAILTALAVARDPLSFEERGRAVLYASDQRHWSVDRGAVIIGLRPDQVRPLPADAELRLPVARLRGAIAEDVRAGRRPWLVVANAGTTNAGAVDPLAELADLCAEYRLWLHVDAAYGWAAALTADGRRVLRGIERCDSINLDPHKWLAQPYDAGCLLVRRGAALAETFATRPEYLQDVEAAADEVNFADLGIALTRRFRALKIWFAIKVLGIEWFRRLVAHGFTLAAYAERVLQEASEFELLVRRELSVVCFRYAPAGWRGDLDVLNRALCAAAVKTRRVFLATTRVQGVVAQRFCFVNWRTTAGDVDEIVRLLQEIGQQLIREKGTES